VAGHVEFSATEVTSSRVEFGVEDADVVIERSGGEAAVGADASCLG
jgi:hypothetical protein